MYLMQNFNIKFPKLHVLLNFGVCPVQCIKTFINDVIGIQKQATGAEESVSSGLQARN
jgi:hypothetical protein